jgi:hypothetical protein
MKAAVDGGTSEMMPGGHDSRETPRLQSNNNITDSILARRAKNRYTDERHQTALRVGLSS